MPLRRGMHALVKESVTYALECKRNILWNIFNECKRNMPFFDECIKESVMYN